jgi:shikimate kinase
MKIFLVGMPGSGKSTLGVKLADALHVEFLDLDTEIERKETKAVKEIFREKGEDYFRLIEAETLRELAGSTRDFVLATGGGAPCFYDGMDTINKTGFSIFLDVSTNELARRLSSDKSRPLLQSEDINKKLNLLLEARLPVYRKAMMTVTNPTVEVILKKLRN